MYLWSVLRYDVTGYKNEWPFLINIQNFWDIPILQFVITTSSLLKALILSLLLLLNVDSKDTYLKNLE